MYFSIEYKEGKIFWKIEKLRWRTSSNNVCKMNIKKIVLFNNPLKMVSLGRHCDIFEIFSFGLNAPKCEIFDCSVCHDFYTIKSPRVGDFGIKILFLFVILCVCSGLLVYAEHMHQELMRSVNIQYTSGTFACTKHTHQELMPALQHKHRVWAKVPSNMMSIRVRN